MVLGGQDERRDTILSLSLRVRALVTNDDLEDPIGLAGNCNMEWRAAADVWDVGVGSVS